MATRAEMYEWVKSGHRAREVEIGLDLKRLNKPGSPLFSVSDNAVPILLLVVATLAAGMAGGLLWALAAAVAGGVGMAIGTNAFVLRRLRQRAVAMLFAGPDPWQVLWDAGVLSLRIAGRPETEMESPHSDWRKFAFRYLRRDPR